MPDTVVSWHVRQYDSVFHAMSSQQVATMLNKEGAFHIYKENVEREL